MIAPPLQITKLSSSGAKCNTLTERVATPKPAVVSSFFFFSSQLPFYRRPTICTRRCAERFFLRGRCNNYRTRAYTSTTSYYSDFDLLQSFRVFFSVFLVVVLTVTVRYKLPFNNHPESTVRCATGDARADDFTTSSADRYNMGVLDAVPMNHVLAALLVSSMWTISCDADPKLHSIISHVNSANVPWQVRYHRRWKML